MSNLERAAPGNAFVEQIRLALKHYHDPAWLGRHSPLATPYFLGQALKGIVDGDTAKGRGKALQLALKAASAELWDGPLPKSKEELAKAALEERNEQGNKSSRYLYLLLELYYLREYFSPQFYPRKTVMDVLEYTATSKSRFFSDYLKQIHYFIAEALLRRHQPTFRLESPQLRGPIWGRDRVRDTCVQALLRRQSVAISGLGGIGKTTLGTAIRAVWPSEAVFWYTIHPGVTDQMGSLLFALAHFINQWGLSSLWLQLMANEGEIRNITAALGFLRDDLAMIERAPPLLCFDDIDLLGNMELRSETQGQVLELLENLRGLAPLLLIGQQALVDTDHHYSLDGLTLQDVGHLLTQAGIPALGPDVMTLHERTKGSPRLIELAIALYRPGDNLFEWLNQLSETPAVRPILERLWKRLGEKERRMLEVLSVFHSAIPAEVWQNDSETLAQLIRRNLVKQDDAGAVWLTPIIANIIYSNMTQEQREANHQRAGDIHATWGEFTAAAHHYTRAGNYAAAVDVWYPHQDVEIARGQADVARQVFDQISLHRLTGKSQKELKLLRDRLHLLRGEAEKVLADARTLRWEPQEQVSERYAEHLNNQGRALQILGHPETALEQYQEALETLTRLSQKIINTHFLRTTVFIRQGEPSAFQKETKLAVYEAEYLQGFTSDFEGKLSQAQEHFEHALAFAKDLNDERRVARVYRELAYLAGRAGNIEEAAFFAQESMGYYQRVGDSYNLEAVRADLGGLYLQIEHYEAVLEPCETALSFFKKVQDEGWIASISCNLAEAYLETGRLEQAKHYALNALHTEEPNSQPYALYTLGLIQKKQGELTNASASFLQGIAIARRNGDKFVEAYLQRALGQMYASLQEGQTHLKAALSLFNEMKLSREVDKTNQLLAESMSVVS